MPSGATRGLGKGPGGWRQEDKLVHEIEGRTGVLVAPAKMTPEEWIREQEAKNLERRRPGGEG